MDQVLSQREINRNHYRAWLRATMILTFIGVLVYFLYDFFTPSLDRNNILTAKVIRGDLSASINAGGVVLPLSEATLLSELDTHIIKVFKQSGSQVAIGEPLLQLDSKKVELNLSNINDQILLKTMQIKSKKIALTQSINEISSRQKLMRVDLESRTTRVTRLTELTEIGAVAKHDLLEAELNVKRSKIELEQSYQAQIDLNAATNADIAALQLEQTLLAKQRTEQQRVFDKATLRATRAGTLTWIKNEEGASVNLQEPIAKIADTTQFKIEATLSDFYASQITPGMPVEITYQNKNFIGKLAMQTPSIINGSMKLLIELEQPQNTWLNNNLRVDVGLITNQKTNTPLIPKGIAIKGRGTQLVFVIKDNIAERLPIEIGMSSTKHYEVLRGLKVGDEIIISDISNILHLPHIKIN